MTPIRSEIDLTVERVEIRLRLPSIPKKERMKITRVLTKRGCWERKDGDGGVGGGDGGGTWAKTGVP